MVDIHGGCSGVPAWMTENRWKELKLSPAPRVSLKALKEVQALLESVKTLSNGSNKLSLEGVNDANSEAEMSATKQGSSEKPDQEGG